VLSRFGASPGSERDWPDRLADYLRAEHDLGRLAPDAAAVLVGICHDEAPLGAFAPHAHRDIPGRTGIGRRYVAGRHRTTLRATSQNRYLRSTFGHPPL
jgi:hypothetical protein